MLYTKTKHCLVLDLPSYKENKMNNSKEKDLSRRENIIRVTLDIIMKEGIEGVTIRKIASRANVNVALISYHFGSKENLINESLKIIVNNLQTAFNILDDSNSSSREKLKHFYINYISIALKYPSVFKQAFYSGALSFQSQNEFIEFLKVSGFDKILSILRDLTGMSDPTELTTMMIQLMGSIIFPILTFPDIKNIIGIDIVNQEGIEKYVDTLLNNYFGEFDEMKKK